MTLVEVNVETASWPPDAAATAERAARLALDGQTGEVAISLTDDQAMRALNRDFRGQDKATNVLAFPAPPALAPHLGDIALGYQTCAREAAAAAKPFENHLSHLIVHGVLHLMGYDHHHDNQAEAMEARERTLLSALGIADPYAERP